MSMVLVTGASGFIGRMLCTHLLSRGFSVRAAARGNNPDNLIAGAEMFEVGDLGEEYDWSQALSGVDMVVHLAARVHQMKDVAPDPLAAYRIVNVSGTERLARAAAANEVRRFVFLSSVKVNGEESPDAYREDDRPAPCDFYGISKWEAEESLRGVSAGTGLETVVIRSPLVYGPGVAANFLNLIRLVDKGIPLPLGSINNRRSFIYLGNLADAIISCLDHPLAARRTFLISDAQDLSTPELIAMIARALGKKPPLFPFPLPLLRFICRTAGRKAEIERLAGSLCVDSNGIRGALGWNPPFTTEEGIRATVEWYRSL